MPSNPVCRLPLLGKIVCALELGSTRNCASRQFFGAGGNQETSSVKSSKDSWPAIEVGVRLDNQNVLRGGGFKITPPPKGQDYTYSTCALRCQGARELTHYTNFTDLSSSPSKFGLKQRRLHTRTRGPAFLVLLCRSTDSLAHVEPVHGFRLNGWRRRHGRRPWKHLNHTNSVESPVYPAEDPALTRMSPLPKPSPPAEPQPLPSPLPLAEPPAHSESAHPTHPLSPSSEGPSGPGLPNNEVENIFANIVVPPPSPPPGLLAPPPLPQPKLTMKTKRAPGPAKAHINVGGTAAEFALHWKVLMDEKPPSTLLKVASNFCSVFFNSHASCLKRTTLTQKRLKGNNDLLLTKSKRIQEILGAASEWVLARWKVHGAPVEGGKGAGLELDIRYS
ncbi:hypothetical protein B0H19DRAFT_1068339 [Mycena capillaripes]|nr:hypothetical protein B0H19DRAFT_1068339 [Mycena capillaripes]